MLAEVLEPVLNRSSVNRLLSVAAVWEQPSAECSEEGPFSCWYLWPEASDNLVMGQPRGWGSD
jgi:hypothetical protein